jgi:hypothetical protein
VRAAKRHWHMGAGVSLNEENRHKENSLRR